jgi:hypothetical protein
MVRLPEGLRPYFAPLKSAYTHGTRAVSPATVRVSKLRGGWLPPRAALTMEEAAADSGRFTLARPEEVLRRPRPAGLPAGDWCFPDLLTETVPRVGVLELDGGRVLQPHAVSITGGNRWIWEQGWYFGTKKPRQHPIYLHPFPGPPTEVPGRLGVLAHRGDVNYYHFLHDVLPKIGLLEQAGIERPGRWYVPYSSKWQRDLLSLVGITESEVVNSTEVRHVRAETLVVPGVAAMTEINPPWVTEFLRSRMLPAGVDRVPGRYLYLTRAYGGLNNRAILNEPDVLALLEPLGFEALDPATLPVQEQIRTFAEADVIVAAHGAALANLSFCSPGAAVVELFPSASTVPCYYNLAWAVPGLEYRYLSGAGPVASTARHKFVVADITVDLQRLEETVSDLLAARRTSGPDR